MFNSNVNFSFLKIRLHILVIMLVYLDIAFLNIENNENESNIRDIKFKCKVYLCYIFEKEIKFLAKIN